MRLRPSFAAPRAVVAALWATVAVACDSAGSSPSPGTGAAAAPTAVSGEAPSAAGGVSASAGDPAAGEEGAPKAEALPASVLAKIESPPVLIAAPMVKVDPTSAGTECPKRRAPGVGVMVSPRVPSKGQPARILVADLGSETAMAVRVEDKDGVAQEITVEARAGVPAYDVVHFTPPKHGKFTIVVGRAGTTLRCREFWVAKYKKKREIPEPELEQVWPVRRTWDASEEALFSAWVQTLFQGAPDEDLAWTSLDQLTTDPGRNLLLDHYGWEDGTEEGIELRPDCADLPYFLRGYFAWKRKLPFGFHRCSRGNSRRGPSCHSRATVAEAPDLKSEWTEPEAEFTGLDVMQRYFQRTLAWGVHTGNGRVGHEAELTDFYPVALDRRSVRPGTVYADPYGHILVVVEFVPGVQGRPGVMFAVDGQPDASITRKRFWEGNFLWNPDPKHGGSGFKTFRPMQWIETEGEAPPGWPEDVEVPEKVLAPLDDKALEKAGYRDRSLADTQLGPEAFYDRVERLITPQPRDPYLALAETVAALAEAARIRVTSVNNGEKWHADHPASSVEMPWGYEVFQTVGAWENFSTPARDLRLLLAIDVVRNFEDKLRRAPESFDLGDADAETVRARVAAARDALLARDEYAFEYTRSDGTAWRLTLADLVARAEQLEMAYNPNDCPEWRWGAPEGSKEFSPCTRRASDDQRKMMAAYRPWFRDRARPPRGDDGPDVPGVERPPDDED
jgi:hypothetical protein